MNQRIIVVLGRKERWKDERIRYGRYGHDWKLDAIFQYGSLGREENRLETYGDLGVDEDGNPRVMSAEEVFNIIKKDWKKMDEVEEMRLNAETEEKTTYAFIKSTEKHTMIEGYVKTWWTENGVIGVTFVNGETYITGANNVIIKETK